MEAIVIYGSDFSSIEEAHMKAVSWFRSTQVSSVFQNKRFDKFGFTIFFSDEDNDNKESFLEELSSAIWVKVEHKTVDF